MKTFRRIMAVMLTLVLSLSVLGVTALAATTDIDSSATGSITVHKYEYNGTEKGTGTGAEASAPEGATALEGVTFTAYKVMDADAVIDYYNGTSTNAVTVNTFVNGNTVKDVKGNAVTGTSLTTGENGTVTFSDLDVGMYVIIETAAPEKVTAPESPFLVSIPMTNPAGDGWMYNVHVYPKNSTSEGNVTLQKVGENGDALSGVTFTLEKENASDDWDPVTINSATSFSTDANGEIKFTELAHGTYRVTETATAEGYILDNRPIVFTVTENNTITCTSTVPTVKLDGADSKALTIKITNEKPDITKDITEGQNTAGVGDTVSFKLTVEIPQNITAMKTFTVKDAPTGLNVDTNTIAVKDGETPVSGCYTTSEDGNGFTLTFTPSDMTAYAGKTLTITYDATVLASAAENNTASNSATLTYTDKLVPDSETDDPTHDDDDTKETKNFKISITKYKDSVADNNKVSGVEFELYDSEGKKVVVTGAAGNYVVAADGATGTTTTLVTGSSGELVVSGLAADTYSLKETKAPDGYNLLSDEIKIELNMEKEGDDLTFTQNIINKAGFNLPKTGGLGTLMFILIGAVLIGGGIYLLAVPSKKRSV